jgi:hypothetical protein
VDYILFEAKEAYCDYYASSMIVMLRSLGIPARLAAGFARGTYEAEVDSFHVLNKDAHSWVEVYFPEYGWIEFEPTAAQPAIIRPNTSERDDSFASGFPLGNEDLQPDQFADRPDGSFLDEDAALGSSLPLIFNIPFIGTQISLPRPGSGAFFLGLSLIVAIAAGGFWWYRRNQENSRANIFTRYQGMVKMAGWMGVALRPWQTPFEHAAVLQRNLPTHSRDVATIASEYVYQTFSNKNGTKPVDERGYASQRSNQSALAWNRLRPAMLKEALRRHFPRWLRK